MHWKMDVQAFLILIQNQLFISELAYDTAKLANENNIKNVFVTNGFMTKECIQMIEPYLDAANIDLKAFLRNFTKIRLAAS